MKTIVKQISSILHSWDPIGGTPPMNMMVWQLTYNVLSERKPIEELMDFALFCLLVLFCQDHHK